VIESFPFAAAGDTSSEGHRYFNYYGCSPDTAEYGRELVYRFDICQSGVFTAEVGAEGDGDPDIHLLDDLREDACLERAHISFEYHLPPGRYYLTVDTWVDSSGVEHEGPFTLDADFVPDPGTEPCPAAMACVAGECVCADGLSPCDGDCVDLRSDPLNCGECGEVCAGDEVCADGDCRLPNADGGLGDGGTGPDGPGCGCRMAPIGSGALASPATTLLVLLCALGAAGIRRTARHLPGAGGD
jgi:hypothetical protein